MHLVAIGGSDAGISAALRARELDPSCEVTVVLADDYPNFTICGPPSLFGFSQMSIDWRRARCVGIRDLEVRCAAWIALAPAQVTS